MRLLQNTRVVKPRPSLFSEGDVHGVRDDPRGALDLARDILWGDHERAEIALAYQPSRGELRSLSPISLLAANSSASLPVAAA